MLSWIIIGVTLLVILVVSKLIHFRHFKHRVTAIVLVLFLLFAYVTFANVVKENNIDIKTVDGIIKAGNVYLAWLKLSFENLKVLSGNAINMNWSPTKGNSFNLTSQNYTK